MKFYTSVIPHRGRLLTRAVVNGKRVKQRINYKPSLFVPVKKDTSVEINCSPNGIQITISTVS